MMAQLPAAELKLYYNLENTCNMYVCKNVFKILVLFVVFVKVFVVNLQ